jgi:hypothetical protein
MTKEYQMNRKNTYKILHLVKTNSEQSSNSSDSQLLLVHTDLDGGRAFTQLMHRLFLFRESTENVSEAEQKIRHPSWEASR